ncbi:DUF2752 domain-containing protein [Nocardioides daphniae]|uniref:DUF2752 domain-containing protein n=1 Tax=Nocardioides daphniae TaxID=402297 RepID=A0A4P7UH85_9ACTN|nr:DUF2752 domain-containing protein [Nocardioides daphniae]
MTSPVGPVPTTRAQRLRPVLAAGAVVGAATLALHLRDPHVQGSWGFCPTALVGFACPFCGSLRAVHHLTDLDLVAAASSNLVLVAAAPVAVVLWLRAVLRAWQGRQPLLPALPAAAWWGIGVALAVFALWRNLPVPLGEWLAP